MAFSGSRGWGAKQSGAYFGATDLGPLGGAILGGDDLSAAEGRFHVAVVAPNLIDALRPERRCHRGPVLSLLGRIVAGRSPVVLHRIGGLHRVPGVARHHRQTMGDGKYLPDPTHAFGLAGIEGLERRALSGIHLNSGVHHTEDRLVDAKAELASDLPLDIEPLGGLADKAPL